MEGICVLFGITAALALVVWLASNTDKLRLFDKDRGGAGAFTAVQEFVEPNVKHVTQVKEQKRERGENGPPDEKSNG